MKTVLKATNLKKTYQGPPYAEVLKGLSFELLEGRSLAIMGKSGSGKSTLLHILGTLEKPCSGELEICGVPLQHADACAIRRNFLGFIFQSYHLLEDETVLQNILTPAKIARIPVYPGSKAHTRALDLIALVGLSHRVDFPTKVLSGGEKQRTAIARAFCNDPPLILADEPTGNLDGIHSSSIHELLISSVKKFNKSLIIVTHDQELSSLCDEVLYLKDGVLCSCSSLELATSALSPAPVLPKWDTM